MRRVKFEKPFHLEPVNMGYIARDFNGLEVGRFTDEGIAEKFINQLNKTE